jgi:hypothetical protein
LSFFKGYGIQYLYTVGNRYEGNFEQGKFSGYGKYFWKNGDQYEGSYVRGLKEGTIFKRKILN